MENCLNVRELWALEGLLAPCGYLIAFMFIANCEVNAVLRLRCILIARMT